MSFILKLSPVIFVLFLTGLPFPGFPDSDFQPTAQFPFNPLKVTEEYIPDHTAFFQNKPVIKPQATPINPTQVLGDLSDVKHIQVDLTHQRLYAFQGERLVYNFSISSGKTNATPTGKFKVWIKLRSQKMSGGSKENGTYYYLPNVPYIMFFYNDQIAKHWGYSLHGTYWHDNFGVPMSHGCVNMRTQDAQKIYYWINPQLPTGKSSIAATPDNPGTEIFIYGKYDPKAN